MGIKRAWLFMILWALAAVGAAGAQVIRDALPGVENLARIESTVACAGPITPQAVSAIKNMGFASIINLRQPEEIGANVEAEAAAAAAAAIHYIHIPFNGGAPDPAAVDRFVETISQPGNEPAFIHCGSGNRAAAMWFVKRALVDEWDLERALTEAGELGLASESLKEFMINYVLERL